MSKNQTLDQATGIDQCAEKFAETKDVKYFNEFVTLARGTIRRHVAKTCTGSVQWDKDELFSILLADMWRLFNAYVPDDTRKFHWLMLRQLRNKTINYIQNTTNRVHKQCFYCGTSASSAGVIVCENCGSSLKKPREMTGVEDFNIATTHFHDPDYLKQTIVSESVEFVLNRTKVTDPVTHKVLLLLLEGYSKNEIIKRLDIAQNSLNYRLRRCATLLEKREVA